MLYTENYQFRKPIIGVDIADVKDLNFNSDKLDALLYNTQISLAPAYDLLETYNTGDIVMYETLMYKCKADNVTGAWDPSKWERTTAGEEGSGGGGSSVVPNPQGTPTETLNTIGIDGTIFDIAGSGGGGGGSAFTETLLYENAGTSAGNITLSDDLSNYDMLMFVVVRTIGVGRELVELPFMTSDLSVGTHITLISYASEYVNYDVTSMTLLTLTNSYSNYVEKVKGIKFGGGSGYSSTKIWDYIEDNNNTIPYGTYTVSLNDDINNYDVLVIENVSSSTDLTDPNWASTNLWYVDVNALNNNWNNNYVTYTSWDNRATKFHIANTTFEALNNTGMDTNGLVRVYGIKYGGAGNSGGYSETSLYTYTGSTRQTTLLLSDAYTDYDAIEFTFGWNLGGDEFETVNVISSSKIVSNVFVNVGGEGRYNYVSRGSADDEIILATATGSWDGSSIIREVRGINY